MNEKGKVVNKPFPKHGTLFDIARAYVLNGLAPIPLWFQGCVEGVEGELRNSLDYQNEKPVIGIEEYLERYGNSLPSENVLRDWFSGKNVNIGIVTGRISGNLVVIDINDPELFNLSINTIKRVLGWSEINTWVVGNGRRFQIYFKIRDASDEDLRNLTIYSDGDRQIDVKGEKNYIIAPPSIAGDCSKYWFMESLGIDPTVTNIYDLESRQWRAVRDALSYMEIPKPLHKRIRVSEKEELIEAIASEILNNRIIKTFTIRSGGGVSVLGIYCYDNGVYYECEEDLRAEIERSLIARGLGKKSSRYIVNEVIGKIERRTRERLDVEPYMIAFRNTLFNWEKFLETGNILDSIEDFDEDKIVFHRIPHNLNMDMVKRIQGLARWKADIIDNIGDIASALCPKTLKAFRDWVGDKWILLYEIIGYTLYPRYPFNKAIMLVGEGSNGKSTYLRLVKNILGRENVVSIPLQELLENRFSIANLHGKLANIYADLPSKPLGETGVFKILTGEDMICADRKFRDRICFTNYAKLLFSTNELPKVSDMTSAFWRRWIVVEFPNRFPPNDRFFEETFTKEEIEGAIIVSILAFYNVYRRKRFSFEESPEDYRRMWLRKTNSVYAFLEDLMTIGIDGFKGIRDPNSRVETEELYRLYTIYCQENDIDPLRKRDFTIEMERWGYRKVIVRGKGYYKGLRVERAPQEQDTNVEK